MPSGTPIHPYVAQTQDALPVEVQRLDRTHVLRRMGLHGHTFFEVILIERAGGRHRVGAETHELEAGQLFIIPPGTLHDCSAMTDAAEGWVLLLTHEALDGLVASSRAYTPAWPSRSLLLSPFFDGVRPAGHLVTLPKPLVRRWATAFAQMAEEMQRRDAGYRLAIQAQLTLLLLGLVRLTGASNHLAAAMTDDALRTAFAFIDERFCRPISTQDVARAAKQSAAHLTTTMRRRTGLTVGEWITERRMAEARRLLVASELGLGDVADRTGYSGPDSFARAFRRAHGLAPAAWRQANRGHPPYC